MSICTSIIDFFNSQIKVIRLTIGVSSQTDNIFKISECYRNTLDIIDNRSISGLSEIVLCDLCSLKEISIGTKELKIYSIINYVMDGMYDEAASEFLNAVESLLSNEPTYAQLIKASTILHKKINGLLLSKDVSDEDIMQLEITLLSELNNIYTINEFKDRVKTYFNEIEDIFNYGSNPSMNNIAENVKAYVRQNYCDPIFIWVNCIDMNTLQLYFMFLKQAQE